MLKPVFDLVKAKPLTTRVWATVTKHTASRSSDAVRDPVRYSNGLVTVAFLSWPPSLFLLKSFKGDITTQANPSFAVGSQKLRLAISFDGQIRVQELTNSVPDDVAKRFQASCNAGLMTIILTNVHWTVSLTTDQFEIPK